jgi:hypothetical protein
MEKLTKEELLRIVEGFAQSIRTQLRAKPLGVEVSEDWILDLARNMAGGLPSYFEEPGTCPYCNVEYRMGCCNGC